MKKNFPSRLVRKLVEKGLVERYTSPDDARLSMHRLSDEGRELVPKLLAAEEKYNESIVEATGDENIEKLIQIFTYYLTGTDGNKKIERRKKGSK